MGSSEEEEEEEGVANSCGFSSPLSALRRLAVEPEAAAESAEADKEEEEGA